MIVQRKAITRKLEAKQAELRAALDDVTTSAAQAVEAFKAIQQLASRIDTNDKVISNLRANQPSHGQHLGDGGKNDDVATGGYRKAPSH